MLIVAQGFVGVLIGNLAWSVWRSRNDPEQEESKSEVQLDHLKRPINLAFMVSLFGVVTAFPPWIIGDITATELHMTVVMAHLFIAFWLILWANARIDHMVQTGRIDFTALEAESPIGAKAN